MNTFSDESISEMWEAFHTSQEEHTDIINILVRREYQTPSGREHALHGLLRRLQLMMACIRNIFDKLPPEAEQPPSSETRQEVEIFLHAFIFNTYGCLENIAWIWVLEKNITKSNGGRLSNGEIGLRKKHKVVRSTFPEELIKYIDRLDTWLDYIDNYRHAAAHRIPLYIPPYLLHEDKDVKKHNEIEEILNRDLSNGVFDTFEMHTENQRKLGTFKPVMMHSYLESAKPMFFHAQVIADFRTIIHLANAVNRNM